MWLNLLIASGVLIGLVGVWFAVHWWLSPHVDSPDAEARVEGSCGDTMEMRVKFEGNRVVDISYWTNGCTYMANCLSAATHLAKGKTLDEIVGIDADVVQKSIGAGFQRTTCIALRRLPNSYAGLWTTICRSRGKGSYQGILRLA